VWRALYGKCLFICPIDEAPKWAAGLAIGLTAELMVVMVAEVRKTAGALVVKEFNFSICF